MKKLNKKGFTLVELLAVIVILALLIVVVATTALPAMNNAKKNTLDTYAKRVVEQAKTLYISDNTKCISTTPCNLIDTMGVDAPKDQYKANLYVNYDSTKGYLVQGWVVDYKNKNISKVTDGVTGAAKCSDITGTGAEATCKLDVLSDVCTWNTTTSKCE